MTNKSPEELELEELSWVENGQRPATGKKLVHLEKARALLLRVVGERDMLEASLRLNLQTRERQQATIAALREDIAQAKREQREADCAAQCGRCGRGEPVVDDCGTARHADGKMLLACNAAAIRAQGESK